jgi:NAD(P)-dependent dehydrogenase (short-subunit alcohol dehydrogenase family)
VAAFVHAAGAMRGAPPAALDRAATERLADLLAPRMPDGGRIVLIGSRGSMRLPGWREHGATKAAPVAMVRAWAQELAPRGVTVNVVAPAATNTPMLQDPARGGSAPTLPRIGPLIRPAEVAALIAFRLGPEAGAITGQQIMVCCQPVAGVSLTVAATRMPVDAFTAGAGPLALRIAAELAEGLRLSLGAIGIPRGRA